MASYLRYDYLRRMFDRPGCAYGVDMSRSKSAQEWFDEKRVVDPETGCHLFSRTSSSGYGEFVVEGGVVKAHRWAFEQERGPIPNNAVIKHSCGIRNCVNPAHLFSTDVERVRERFDSLWVLNKETGCHEYTACTGAYGYGQFVIDGKQYRAHRWIYEEVIGPIPNGLYVCHKCDVRHCVNPKHLFLGTAADNAADMVRKGRQNAPFGENCGRSKLKEREVKTIRKLLSKGFTQTEIANKYNVTQSLISRINCGQRWRHLSE